MFVTSEFYQGDFGGLLGADHVCQILAEEAGLERASTFMAWLADETGAPLTRFHRSKGRYALVTGLPIAESWDDLTDGMIKTPIVVDERGELTDGTAVFTNTTVGGSLRDSDASCESWTAIGVEDQTWIGYSGATDFEWVDSTFANPYGCPASARLYCFEQ